MFALASARSALLLAALTLVACGSDRPGGGMDGGGADGGGADGGSRADGGGGPIGRVSESEHASVVARAWCAHQQTCDCLMIDADEDACVTRIVESLGHRAEMVRGMGLMYDDRCAGEILRKIEVKGCSGYSFPATVGCEPCELYYGTVAQGQPCMQIAASGATQCAQGMLCLVVDGATEPTCEDPCEVFPRYVLAGEACDRTGTGPQCEPLEAFCNPESMCEAFPVLDEMCPIGRCSGDAYCDSDTNTCLARQDRGTSCGGGVECSTGNCQGDVCVSFCGPRPF